MDSPFLFARQRVLVLAPHPDDESLATGGLIQRALSDGAEVQIVFVTDGDNNPWPQRYLERRWHIGASDRRRWGLRRREEALSALRRLGVPPDAVQFLGQPDQGTTDALLRADRRFEEQLADALSGWPPTIVVAPSPHDVHPDHNALSILTDLTLETLPPLVRPRVLHYLVHTRPSLPTPAWRLRLTADERETKRLAILEHTTQMALSRKRFLGFARPVEEFHPPGAMDRSHPIRSARVENGTLHVHLRPSPTPFPRHLLVALQSPRHGSVRWRVRLGWRSGLAPVSDCSSGQAIHTAMIQSERHGISIHLPLTPALPIQRAALKIDRRITFYDGAGWLQIESLGDSHRPPALLSREDGSRFGGNIGRTLHTSRR